MSTELETEPEMTAPVALGSGTETSVVVRQVSGTSHLPMRPSMRRTALLTAVVTLLNPLGNLVLAWGMKALPDRVGVNILGYLGAMLNPAVAGGIVLLILWMLMRMSLMSVADLSFILPVTAVGYVLSALFGKAFLHETVTPWRWAGTVLILFGAALASSRPKRSMPPDDLSRSEARG